MAPTYCYLYRMNGDMGKEVGNNGVVAPGLRPQLHLYDAVATGLAAILGAGIFAVIAPAAGLAGPAILVSLLIAAAVAFCNAMSSVQLARVLPRTGGTYRFANQMLGPWWGFIAGWMFVAANSIGPGVIAIAFGGYAHAAEPAIDARVAAVVMAVAICTINASGIRRSTRATDVMVVLSVLSLLGVIVLGLPHASAGNLTPFAPHGVLGIFRATGLLFFAYTGYSRIATLVEEVHNPRRTIPIASATALGTATILYLLVAVTALAVVGASTLSHSSSPLRTTLLVAGIAAGPAIVVAGALITTFNEGLSDLLGVSRVVWAMAQCGDLPAKLGETTDAANPWVSVVFVGGISILVAAFAPFTASVAISSFGTLLYYSITNASALKLKPEDRMFPPWLSILGLIGCVVLALTLVPTDVAIGAAVAAVGLLSRFVRQRMITNPPAAVS